MSTITQINRALFKSHWFFLVTLIVLAIDASVVLMDRWQTPQLIEAGLLFDFAILIPLLYLLCYRARGKRTIIRCIALACLGIWAVGHIVPEANHHLLDKLGFLRYIGLGVLVIFEIRVVVAIYRATFSIDPASEQKVAMLAEESGMPPWVAKLMAWEASTWRKIMRLFLNRNNRQ